MVKAHLESSEDLVNEELDVVIGEALLPDHLAKVRSHQICDEVPAAKNTREERKTTYH